MWICAGSERASETFCTRYTFQWISIKTYLFRSHVKQINCETIDYICDHRVCLELLCFIQLVNDIVDGLCYWDTIKWYCENISLLEFRHQPHWKLFDILCARRDIFWCYFYHNMHYSSCTPGLCLRECVWTFVYCHRFSCMVQLFGVALQ